MADPISAAVTAVISYVGSASAAVAAGTATVAQTATVVAVNLATSAAVSAASALLTPDVSAAGNPTDWIADPDAPLRYAIGRGGAAGQIVLQDEYGPDNMYLSIVSVIAAGGPIKAFAAYEFDDQPVTFNPSTGAATSSQWVNEMWLTTRRGLQPDTALTSPAGLKNSAALPGWNSASKLSGKAAYMLTMAENSKRTAFPSGIPKPLITWEGCFGWDPRLDSTYPGGSGACRLNDPATWVWIDNPALGALKWAIGFWEGPSSGGKYGVPYDSVLVGGFGAKVEGIDVPAFVEAANIADANGWTVAAYPSSADSKAQVMDALLQACGAIYAEKAGRISCIHRAAPRASVVTISAADTAGPLELDTTVSRIGRINTIRPRYWSEANRWQMTAAGEVTASSYVTEDGGRRTRGVDYPFVRAVQQAAELAALQLANTREGFRGVIPLKPHLQRIRPGDAFTITEPGFLLDGQKCLCLDTEFDAATGVHRVTFVSETDAKYPFAYGQSPDAPEPATLSPNPGPPAPPAIEDWTIVPRPPGDGGVGLPGLDLTGNVSNAAADRVLVEYGPTNNGPWSQAFEGPPTTSRLEVTVPAGGVYFVAVTYFDRAGVPSSRTVFGPYTAPGLVAEDAANLGGVAADHVLTDIEAAQAEAASALAGLAAEITRATSAEGTISASVAALSGTVNSNFTTLSNADAGLAAQIATTNSTLSGFTASTNSTLASLATADAALAGRTTTLEALSGPRPNLCPNGGLENGLAGLTSNATMQLGNNVFGRSVDLVPAGSGTYSINWPAAPIFPGFAYTISGDAKLFASGGVVYFDMLFIDANGNVLLDSVGTPRGIGDFSDAPARRQEMASWAIAPAGAAFVVARCVFEGVVNPTGMSARRVKVEQGGLPATAYTPEGGVNLLSARVSTSEGAITSLQGRTQAWWQSQTQAGESATLIRAQSDAAAGSSIMMVADKLGIATSVGGVVKELARFEANKIRFGTDVAITGDLLVDGAITNAKISSSAVTRVNTAVVNTPQLIPPGTARTVICEADILDSDLRNGTVVVQLDATVRMRGNNFRKLFAELQHFRTLPGGGNVPVWVSMFVERTIDVTDIDDRYIGPVSLSTSAPFIAIAGLTQKVRARIWTDMSTGGTPVANSCVYAALTVTTLKA